MELEIAYCLLFGLATSDWSNKLYKLRLHDISTVHGHRARARQLLSTEHAIPSTTRTTPVPKALSVLSGNIATADELVPAAGDIRGGLRPTSRSCRSFCACPLYSQKRTSVECSGMSALCQEQTSPSCQNFCGSRNQISGIDSSARREKCCR
jgi:hypothetical protein